MTSTVAIEQRTLYDTTGMRTTVEPTEALQIPRQVPARGREISARHVDVGCFPRTLSGDSQAHRSHDRVLRQHVTLFSPTNTDVFTHSIPPRRRATITVA